MGKQNLFILISFFLVGISLCGQDQVPPVTDILTPVWTTVLPDRGGKAMTPAVIDNTIVPPTPSLLYDCETGQNIAMENISIKTQVAYMYNEWTKSYVSFYDFNPFEKIIVEEKAGSNQSTDVFPVPITDYYYYVKNGQIFKYNANLKSKISIADEGLMPQSKICASSKYIFYTNENKLVVRDKNTGMVGKVIELPARASGLYIDEENLFVWLENIGVQCYNVSTFKLLWKFKVEDANVANVHFETENGCLYFSAWDIYCLEVSTGKLIWKTVEKCSQYSSFTRVMNGYLIHYNSCFEEGEIPAIIEILDAFSGEIKYRGWTSATYPPDEYWGISEMDMQGWFSFALNSCGNIIVGLRGGVMQGFKLKEK